MYASFHIIVICYLSVAGLHASSIPTVLFWFVAREHDALLLFIMENIVFNGMNALVMIFFSIMCRLECCLLI